MPGSSNHHRRTTPADSPGELLRVLSPLSSSSVIGAGQPGDEAGVDSRTRESGRIPASGRPPPSLHASGGLNVGASQSGFHGKGPGRPRRISPALAVPCRIPASDTWRSASPVMQSSLRCITTGDSRCRDPLGKSHRVSSRGCRMELLSPTGSESYLVPRDMEGGARSRRQSHSNATAGNTEGPAGRLPA